MTINSFQVQKNDATMSLLILDDAAPDTTALLKYTAGSERAEETKIESFVLRCSPEVFPVEHIEMSNTK